MAHSTIHIDLREGGSQQSTTAPKLLARFLAHRFHPHADLLMLSSGDFAFTGNGPHSTPYSIGFERKRLGSLDFFHSVYSGRLLQQLSNMLELYDVAYLIIEGQGRVNQSTGTLEEKWGGSYRPVGDNRSRKTYTGEELLGMMNSILLMTPVKIIRTFGVEDTVDVVSTLWHWWQKKWESHSTTKTIYTPQNTVSIGKASTVRRVAAQLRGVGWEKSGEADMKWKSVIEMVGAEEAEWMKLPGIGKTLAKRIVSELKGETPE